MVGVVAEYGNVYEYVSLSFKQPAWLNALDWNATKSSPPTNFIPCRHYLIRCPSNHTKGTRQKFAQGKRIGSEILIATSFGTISFTTHICKARNIQTEEKSFCRAHLPRITNMADKETQQVETKSSQSLLIVEGAFEDQVRIYSFPYESSRN